MKEAARHEEKRMTVKEVAERLGCSHEAIRKYVKELFPDLMQHGKTTYLTEAQVTAVLERMKAANRRYDSSKRNATYNNIVVSSETAKTKVLQLAMLYKSNAETMRNIAVLERELKEEAIKENAVLRTPLHNTEARLGSEVIAHDRTRSGLAMYQRIAEAAGFVKSDRDDVLDTYRRRP